jgi:hypothetical protein
MEVKMSDKELNQEVQWYKDRILEASAYEHTSKSYGDIAFPEVVARFKNLVVSDIERWRQIVSILLADEIYEIRFGTLKLLQSIKMRDTKLSLLVMHIALEEPLLMDEAFHALWRVATHTILPQIMQFAEKGHAEALYMARHLLRSPEEIQRGITVARTYLLSEEYALREASLFLLQKYSSMETEAQLVLDAAQKYLDELFIDALKEAPPEVVLEPLKAIRSSIGKEYAEYKDLSSTIDILEKSSRTSDSASNMLQCQDTNHDRLTDHDPSSCQ